MKYFFFYFLFIYLFIYFFLISISEVVYRVIIIINLEFYILLVGYKVRIFICK